MEDPKQTNLFSEGDGEEEETEDQGGAESEEACGPDEGCEPEGNSGDKGTKKGNGKGRAATKAAPATQPAPAKVAAPTAKTFTYPFNVRYNAEMLDLAGFVDGQTYKGSEIRNLLVQNGWTEFRDYEPDFHLSEVTNTVVITFQGNKKGYGYGC